MTTTLREVVAERARYCCEYCFSQVRFSPDPFSIEHIIPLAADGTNALENLALSCQGCNNHKYTSTMAIDPISGKKVILYNPRFDTWEKHFAWVDDYAIIVGLTPTGRASIEKLKLNREGVVNLRRALRVLNLHPV